MPIALERAQRIGQRTTLVTPMLRQGEAIGTIMIRRLHVEAFTETQIAALEAFAAQAVIAIENARLFQELQERTAQLTRSVEEQRALAEVSQAVSSSLDLQEVLTTIVAHATRLADADAGTIFELDEAAPASSSTGRRTACRTRLIAAVRAGPADQPARRHQSSGGRRAAASPSSCRILDRTPASIGRPLSGRARPAPASGPILPSRWFASSASSACW